MQAFVQRRRGAVGKPETQQGTGEVRLSLRRVSDENARQIANPKWNPLRDRRFRPAAQGRSVAVVRNDDPERDGILPRGEQAGVEHHAGLKPDRPVCRRRKRQGQIAEQQRRADAGGQVLVQNDREIRLRGVGSPQRMRGPRDRIRAVRHAVAVLVGIERIGALEHLRAVGNAVAVGVRIDGTGSVQENLVAVRQPVAVRVREQRLARRGFAPLDGEARRRPQCAVRAKQVRKGERRARRARFAVHAPDGRGEDVGSENGECVHAVRADLRAHDEVRRRRIERVRKVVAEDEAAGGQKLGLNGDATAGETVDQGVLPRQHAAAARSRVVPETRTGSGVRPVRLGNHSERREKRRQRGKSGAVGKRRADGRPARRFEGEGAACGDVDAGDGVLPDAKEGFVQVKPDPVFGSAVQAPGPDLDRRRGLGAERDAVRADLDRRDGRRDGTGRRRRPEPAGRIVRPSAGLRAADRDRADETRHERRLCRKPRPTESAQPFAHLRRAFDRLQNAEESEPAPERGKDDGKKKLRGFVHGRFPRVDAGRSAHLEASDYRIQVSRKTGTPQTSFFRHF